MEPKIIVMITMLALPGAGDSNVHVRQFNDAKSCIEAADIEATDPFVSHVECAALNDGRLTLKFKPGKKASGQLTPKPTAQQRGLRKTALKPAG